MRVLVLGGYGLIGSHVVARLLAAGHDVVGLGRHVSQAERRFQAAEWIAADISLLREPNDWIPILGAARCEAVVNAAGVLQDGAHDRVHDVQSRSMRALYAAAPGHGVRRFVQISATRADPDAPTPFMRSKGEADQALAASDLEWVILRPGLVISPDAYGGTALLRALAAMPLVVPVAFGDSPVQTVAAEDVADAVTKTLEGRVAPRRIYDLVEEEAHCMRDVLRRTRRWLGFAPAIEFDVPAGFVGLVARIADGLGWLGWRSPFRSTAVTELAAGIRGDPAAWRAETGQALASLDTTLGRLPATVQERWFSRLFLLKPLTIGALSGFWLLTGIVALVFSADARLVLTGRGVGGALADTIVVVGAVVDIVLGLAVLVGTASAHAARGMIFVTLAYLLGGSVLAPGLWLDPLGPLLKALPALIPALLVLALDGER